MSVQVIGGGDMVARGAAGELTVRHRSGLDEQFERAVDSRPMYPFTVEVAGELLCGEVVVSLGEHMEDASSCAGDPLAPVPERSECLTHHAAGIVDVMRLVPVGHRQSVVTVEVTAAGLVRMEVRSHRSGIRWDVSTAHVLGVERAHPVAQFLDGVGTLAGQRQHRTAVPGR